MRRLETAASWPTYSSKARGRSCRSKFASSGTAVSERTVLGSSGGGVLRTSPPPDDPKTVLSRSEEHTSELQSQSNLVCRLLLEKKKASWAADVVKAPTRHPRRAQ